MVLKGSPPVAGAPVIRQLSKKRSDDGQHKVLICEAEGSPKPSVYWSINGTSVRKLIHLTNTLLFAPSFISRNANVTEIPKGKNKVLSLKKAMVHPSWKHFTAWGLFVSFKDVFLITDEATFKHTFFFVLFF